MASTLTNLLVHVVFSTKGREPIITNRYRSRLHAYIGGIIRSVDAQSLSIGGMPDHFHLAMKIRSNQALSEFVRKIKANSSKWINENQFCKKKFFWQNGYGGFSVSASQINKVRNYIENQADHHKSKTFKEELIEILDKHSVNYDPKYLWD
jgi:REP element-mobilizing transposase RayT